ncbi:MAG: hypothetical protein AAF843_08430 [Bacteroidota bacterium]
MNSTLVSRKREEQRYITEHNQFIRKYDQNYSIGFDGGKIGVHKRPRNKKAPTGVEA